jgi:integrase/recombinase XerD
MSESRLSNVGDAPDEDAVRWLQSFVIRLREDGYSKHSIYKRRWAAGSLLRWLQANEMTLETIDESHTAAFVERPGRRPKDRHGLERTAARLFLLHVRATLGAVAPPRVLTLTPAQVLERSYEKYLRSERGLAHRSVEVYLPYARQFVSAHSNKQGQFCPPHNGLQVQEYLLTRIHGRQSEYCRLVCAVLRSFLRFLFYHAVVPVDLSGSIPRVRRWTLAHVPEFLTPAQVEQVLAATNRTTAKERRDFAVLLLLARLGLRAGEVVALELDDIRWRTGEIVVHGKGQTLDSLPLLADVGQALADYIQHDRRRSSSRRLFLREIAPHGAFSGPAAVGHIVRSALARAGIQRRRGAAHLFRHGLATQMVRKGASLLEIAEVLRHRSSASAEIYAKVSFESLRQVGRPWPGAKEVR